MAFDFIVERIVQEKTLVLFSLLEKLIKATCT